MKDVVYLRIFVSFCESGIFYIKLQLTQYFQTTAAVFVEFLHVCVKLWIISQR